MRFSWKNVRWGAVFSAIVLLLGFHAAIEVAGGFWTAATYGATLGLLGLTIAWVNGAQAQKTLAFWMGAVAIALPLGYVMYTYPTEVQLILTLAWLIIVLLGITLACRKVWRRSATQQPTS